MHRTARIASAFVLALVPLLFATAGALRAQAAAETPRPLQGPERPGRRGQRDFCRGRRAVYAYGEIGVAVARSADPAFRDALLTDYWVEGASATTNFASPLQPVIDQTADDVQIPAGFDYQWDMSQILGAGGARGDAGQPGGRRR